MSKPEFDGLHKLVMRWSEVAEKINTAKHLPSFGYRLLEPEELLIILEDKTDNCNPTLLCCFTNLVVRMNEDEEAGKYLRKHEEIAEEPALTGRGDRGEVTPDMVPVTLIVSEGIIHLTVLPILPALILQTVRNN